MRTSASASWTMPSTSVSSRRACTGRVGASRRTSSHFSVIADRLKPSRSCRSRANLRRSVVAARRAISARERWSPVASWAILVRPNTTTAQIGVYAVS
ncbi:hypothetical protein ACIBL5_02440 [Streptomyces sp. NPDC050516]|uniref:hypothetical protein n=1 Tax=Streptomyces sp. NPDC050516 TaxID=3365621 RepID=UPI0037948C8D